MRNVFMRATLVIQDARIKTGLLLSCDTDLLREHFRSHLGLNHINAGRPVGRVYPDGRVTDVITIYNIACYRMGYRKVPWDVILITASSIITL